jgi:integral membrane protein (TIGR01906 family)
VLIARWLSTALFYVALPTFLVLTNVRFAAVEPRVYEYGFTAYDAVEVTGLPRPELDRAAQDIARYFTDDRTALATRVEVDGNEESLFNPREVAHMVDVKALFQRVFRIHEAAFVYLFAYVAGVFLWSRERSMRRFAQQSVIAGIITAGVLTAAALAMLVGFDRLFLQFHLLSFSNDFWQLNPATDRLVQMFPQGFWFDVSLAIGVLSVMQGGLIALAGFGYLRWTEPSRRRARGVRRALAREPG